MRAASLKYSRSEKGLINIKRGEAHPKHKVRRRANTLLIKYGIDTKQFDAIFESQNKTCAICRDENKTKRSFHVDHDHKTGRVRGILCYRCNLTIGFAREKISILEGTIAYLKRNAMVVPPVGA